jgi:hypothetical protein
MQGVIYVCFEKMTIFEFVCVCVYVLYLPVVLIPSLPTHFDFCFCATVTCTNNYMYLLKKKKKKKKQVTQLFRRSPIILKNMIMFTVAGLILGALYTDTLSNWPDGGDGYCGNGFYDDGSCGRNGDDDPEDQPHLSYGDCESRIWPGVQTDMDLTYRQVFEIII